MDKISIIIPVYNVEKYINRCIDSLLNQTYKNIEIILIDDGSTDNSGKQCDIYEKKDKRIKVKHIKNQGVTKARMVGVSLATGNYITFVDSDDYIEITTYETLMKFLKENKLDICVFNYYIVQNDRVKIHKNKDKIPTIMNTNEYLSLMCKNNFGGMMWNKIYKKELILNNLKSLENGLAILEDLLFNCELCEKYPKLRVGYINNLYYYYIIRKGSALNSDFSPKSLDSIYAQIKILDILKKTNNSAKDTYELNFYINAKYMLNEMKINKYSNYKIEKEISEKIEEIIEGNIFKKRVNLILKLKCFVYMHFEKLYFILKGRN